MAHLKNILANMNIKTINQSLFSKLILSNKTIINPDTFVCNCTIKNESNSLSNYILPGMHISIYSNYKIGNTFLSKRYTPFEYIDESTFKLLIKVYKFNNEFGKVGSYISKCIDNNQNIDIKFSYGKIVYVGNGEFLHKVQTNNDLVISFDDWERKKYQNIGFIAAGTGITPILRIINESLSLKEDENIKLKLLFLNYSKEELYLANDLLSKAQIYKDRLQIKLISTNDEGLLASETVNSFFKENTEVIYSCGSKMFINNYLTPMLNELKFINYTFYILINILNGRNYIKRK